MAGRDVTLKIKVDDSEVKNSEAALKRLKNAAKDTATDGRGRAVDNRTNQQIEEQQRRAAAFATNGSKTASNALTQVESAMASVAEASTAAEAGLAGVAVSGAALTAVAALLVVGIVAVAAALAVVFKQAVDAAKAWADYTLEVANAAEANGIATTTMAALRAEADAQGRSISGLDGIVSNFRKTIGEATAGSEEARAKLKLLGIDGSKAIYDIDGAFKTALTAIFKVGPGFEQMRLGVAAFGEDFYKLQPFFQTFNGDIESVIRKAEELGIQLGGKEVAQAREFTRAYAEIDAVIKGLKTTFIREFLPGVISALKEFSAWLQTNKDDIKAWAVWIGEKVGGIVYYFVLLIEKLSQIKRDIQEMADMEARNRGDYVPQRTGQSPLQVQPQSFGMTPNPASAIPDQEALAAALEAAKKIQEEIKKREQEALAARIELIENSTSQLSKVYDSQFQKFTDEFKETMNVEQYQANWDALKQWYGSQINELVPKWQAMVEQQTLAAKKGADEQILIKTQLDQKFQALTDKTTDHDTAAAKAIKEVQKKASADYLKNLEAEMNRAIELHDERNQTDMQQVQRDHELTLVSERQMIDKINKLELDSLTNRKAELKKFLAEIVGNKEKETEVKQQIAVLDQKIAQQEITNANRITEAEKKHQEELNKLLKLYSDYKQSLEDQLDAVTRGNRPLTVYEQTMRDLQRDYKDLDPTQKQNLLNIAAEIDAVTELNKQHAELKEFFKTSLRYIFEGNFKGLIENFKDRFKDMFADKLADVFATSVLGFNPNQTNNPVAKPIVKSIDKTNDLLKQILTQMGGTPTPGGASGIGGIFSSIFGGGAAGSGPGMTPNFNPNSGSGGTAGGGRGAFDNLLGRLLGAGEGRAGESSGSGGGTLFGNLKKLFSTGEGGIFAPQRNLLTGKDSKLGGILGGIGSLASLAGGLIGGNFGGVLSSVGMGLSIGAMFGPIGAVVGGVIGAIAGIFGIGSKRKKEEKIRAKGLTDAEAAIRRQFDSLAEDVRFGRIDSASAITQGSSIGEQVRAQYLEMANSLTDGKTRRHALQDVSRIDSLIASKMAELRGLSDIANASAERSKRILPEFAGGTYFADFFRPNGLIPGIFDSRDDMMAMLSRGEMVLNPGQQNNVRSLAGFDVFAGAGIPNYPRANPSTKLAGGGITGAGLALASAPPTVVINPTIVLEGVAMDDRIEAFMIGDKGVRTQIAVQKKLKKSGDIS